MARIEWEDGFSVGNDVLDSQHKILIDLINRLDGADASGDDLRDIMDRLQWYVAEHFTLEEKLMADAGYGAQNGHAAEHREFESWLKAAQSHMATGGIGQDFLATAVKDHLREWLVEHILVSDMAYKGKL